MKMKMIMDRILSTTSSVPYDGLVTASHEYALPYPLINEVDIHNACIMDLLLRYVYPRIGGYSKFTISMKLMDTPMEGHTFTIGDGIPLTDMEGEILDYQSVMKYIRQQIHLKMEEYSSAIVSTVSIRAYISRTRDSSPPSKEAIDNILDGLMRRMRKWGLGDISPTRKMGKSMRSYSNYMKVLKPVSRRRKSFIVADIETIQVDNGVHVPYAIGYLFLSPGQRIDVITHINTFYTEDHRFFIPDFIQRSSKILRDFISNIRTEVKREKTVITVYFHNLSRFDGIFLLKHIVTSHTDLRVVPLTRNNRIYEIAVYKGNKKEIVFRDSYLLLQGKLAVLGRHLCPELGCKGNIDHSAVTLDSLITNQSEYTEYMRQDIRLLGGILLKAQQIYSDQFEVDIVSSMTLSSLSLKIFRTRFYNDIHSRIYIPNTNEDTFIRRGYYGGHTDVYKPYGKDLYYYDINSLYPFIMQGYKLPGGKPVWHKNLSRVELDDVCGFVLAHVECPRTMDKPYLPYRTERNTLIYPTGEWLAVYYSEELKFARTLGYKIIPVEGYLFEEKDSPFGEYVTTLYQSRLKAKGENNLGMSFVYKQLMNSLYGRFGINPECVVTEILSKEDRDIHLRYSKYIFDEMLTDNKYIVSYRKNTMDEQSYRVPTISAVHLSAAITACARIYMYPYISREDSYYTDTDSVVLGNPLPESMISPDIMGMFKLEAVIKEGYFLAPKAYHILSDNDQETLKYKGAAKSMMTRELFIKLFKEPSSKMTVQVERNFSIDWKSLSIRNVSIKMKLGIIQGNKRENTLIDGIWSGTKPLHVCDIKMDHSSHVYVDYIRMKAQSQAEELESLKRRIEAIEKEHLTNSNTVESLWKTYHAVSNDTASHPNDGTVLNDKSTPEGEKNPGIKPP